MPKKNIGTMTRNAVAAMISAGHGRREERDLRGCSSVVVAVLRLNERVRSTRAISHQENRAKATLNARSAVDYTSVDRGSEPWNESVPNQVAAVGGPATRLSHDIDRTGASNHAAHYGCPFYSAGAVEKEHSVGRSIAVPQLLQLETGGCHPEPRWPD